MIVQVVNFLKFLFTLITKIKNSSLCHSLKSKPTAPKAKISTSNLYEVTGNGDKSTSKTQVEEVKAVDEVKSVKKKKRRSATKMLKKVTNTR